MYRLSKNDYQNLLRNAITTTYKKANKNIETEINKEDVKFAKQADILDKIEMNRTGYFLCYFKRPQRELYEPSYYKAHKSI